MRTGLIALALLLLLAGCREEKSSAGASGGPGAMAARGAEEQPGRAVERRLFLALETRREALAGHYERHLAACTPPACEVEVAELRSPQSGWTSAKLMVRLVPAALEPWLAVVSRGVTVAERRETALDLTSPTLDATARLEAQRDLRTRLRETLARNPSMPLADLLAWERELARVQGEIESAESQLRALQLRTQRVAVEVQYSEHPVQPRWWQPLSQVIGSAHVDLVANLAIMLETAIALLAWAPLILLALWAGLRYRRWRRARDAADANPFSR
jgi:hypothetical protein